jgi:hypothetical protein
LKSAGSNLSGILKTLEENPVSNSSSTQVEASKEDESKEDENNDSNSAESTEAAE